MRKGFVLGAGVTGLSVGYSSGLPVYEQEAFPGGICSSYYVEPGSQQRTFGPARPDGAYRFEHGGGHWIFGADTPMLRFLHSFTPMVKIARRSSVFFPDTHQFVPYPIQNHLRHLGHELATASLAEMTASRSDNFETMAEWLKDRFGRTLCDLFFKPFHELYTAGLWTSIAPQDGYKTPIALEKVIAGAFGDAPEVGYNVRFAYAPAGLDELARGLAAKCDVRYSSRVTEIDIVGKNVRFENGDAVPYDFVISTLPLNVMVRLSGLRLSEPSNPFTSVLVFNIGAKRGPKCPGDHWLYIPRSEAGFHRVGFYSNVDSSYLAGHSADDGKKVSIYVEKAFQGGQKPDAFEVERLATATVKQLQEWGMIAEAEVVDPSWIEVAYTWLWPGSRWVSAAVEALEHAEIYPVGRYAQWRFQGISDSIQQGLVAGSLAARRASG